jgi:hypothetical protein
MNHVALLGMLDCEGALMYMFGVELEYIMFVLVCPRRVAQ